MSGRVPSGEREPDITWRFEMNRKALWWGVLVIGIALIVAPLAMGLPGKAAAGERMMGDFQPIMAPDQVQQTADYYFNVFTPLGQITPVFTNANATKFQNYLQGMQTAGIKIPPAAAKDFTGLVGMMKQAVPIATQVPAGLAHYKPLVTTMQGNVSDFKQINSLPSFNLFAWFFMVPGVLLLLLSGAGLWNAGAVHFHIHRPHLAA
jgi:hypothetical protein